MIVVGLLGLFVTGFLASTLLPMGSEPILVAYLLHDGPHAIWPTVAAAVAVIGLGNTLGGVFTYGMGRGARYFWGRWRQKENPQSASHRKARAWLDRWGPWSLLLSWLPGIGDPMCLVAGAMRLPFWLCTLAIAIGKYARYVVVAAAVLALQG
jgi:membrane protein YqaA with SNARE-associated domain